jgi:hypothetical protein
MLAAADIPYTRPGFELQPHLLQTAAQTHQKFKTKLSMLESLLVHEHKYPGVKLKENTK